MAKKRKLAAITQRQAEREQKTEALHGTVQPEAPEPTVEDGVQLEGQEEPQVSSAATEDVHAVESSVLDSGTVAAVDEEGDGEPMEEVPVPDSAVVDSGVLALPDDNGDTLPEPVGGDSSTATEAVSSALSGDGGGGGDGDGDGDGMPGVVASVVEGEGGVDPEVPALAYGEGEDDNEPESIQKLLEPLSKEQLINLLSEAAGKHTDLMERVNQVVDEDPVHRKIFVHGLGWETTVDTLASFFRQYGVIEDSNVVCDKVSGKSKGYGFILFKHRTGARRALKNPQKKIGNRMTACQMASAGPAPAPTPPLSEYTQRKIYVSNVSSELDPQKVLQFFAKYGEIEEGPLGLDKLTGKPKGFALFVYKTPDGARKALEEPHKNFDGHILHCQKAIDGPKPSKLGLQSHNRGLHHGAAGGGAQGSHLTRGETASFGVGGHLQSASLGHLMAPANTGLGYKKGSASGAASGSGFNPGFGQNLAPLLANPGAGLGLPMGSLLVNSGARGMQGAYGNQPAGIAGNVNPGMMGTYGGHTPIQGGYGNPMMAHGAGRGKHATGHRGGVSHYMP